VARDLPIKNGLAERLEGEHLRYRTQAQGGETAATAPSGALEIRAGTKRGWVSRALNIFDGLKYHHMNRS